ncbi:cation:dicarboxylate symporter family transporter [Fangia hongkongensis]|uniref:cation:dicarboxylate symporter family transporter n=1 Tax=Fangia hongkongensis TaxID=270495 RepID=UPI000379C0ED|nr:cation:dicarboxylase symporter family transporter [Fangia hongkongensis]MBK2125792.1 dicarboxylate/amino acid:cation symporter [Fangia hongkongensis]
MLIVIFLILIALLIIAQLKGISFNLRAVSSLVIGVVFGIFVKTTADVPSESLISLLNFFSDTYISLLKMLIIPLVFTAIIHAIVNLRHHEGSYLTRMAFKSIAVILILTGISAVIGGFIGSIMHIGTGMHFDSALNMSHSNTSIVSTVVGMLPSNPIAAMVNNNVIAVVIFAAFLGVAALKLHKQDNKVAEPFIGVVHSTFFVAKKLANMIISLTPYGVIALMSLMTIEHGLSTLLQMINFIGAMYIAMIVVMIMHTILIVLSGVNPIFYYKSVWRALLVAFTTRSSFGTLPVTMDALSNRLKLSESVSNFTPSIGATIGMNACAGVYPAMLVVMTLAIMGEPITWQIILLVGAINMIASLGVSGIPGTAFVAAGVTFATLGLPFNIIALVQGVDPILDMGRTATNVNGTMTTAVITDKTTKLDPELATKDNNALEGATKA